MEKKFTVFIAILFHFLLSSQNVNPFTGSFNYNQSLLYIPSDRGNGIAIDASYKAGIQMNQPAGDIGLGWSLNTGGAIYRTMIGFPDDMKDYTSIDMVTGRFTSGQGALYPAYTGTSTNCDLISTSKGAALDSVDFTVPAFDNFSVDAPAFGGQMKLSNFMFYEYYRRDVSGTATPPDFEIVPFQSSGAPPYRAPQFHFIGDFADTLVSRHYSTTVTGTTPFRSPADPVTGLGYTNSPYPFVGKHLNGTTISDQNFDPVTGRLGTSNFVEYFTNKEIDDASSHSFTNTADVLTAASSSFVPFIDYKSSHDRSSSTFPEDGIGYFRITASNGLTYHYSLPVYELQTVDYSAPLDNDYTLPNYLSSPSFTYGVYLGGTPNIPDEYYTQTTPNYIGIKHTNTNKYASKWQLTAITGRDFVDADHNHMVNDLDEGYWISYDYQLWNSGFITRSPLYGFNYQYSNGNDKQNYPVYYPIEPGAPGDIIKLTGLFGTVNVSKSEEYYLSKIRTSSHTAVFVMDTRKDEKGGNPDDYIPSGFKPDPSLLVKRILLFNNADFASVVSGYPPTYSQSNYSNNSAFNFTNSINTTSTFFTESWFQSMIWGNSSSILKNVTFDQDYSLCRNYHGNIEVTCANSSPLMNPAAVQNTLNLAVSNYTSSGKLTLKRILTYDFQNVKVTPSTMFSYQEQVVNGNPDYDPRMTDYWGYFKSDVTDKALSRYTNSVSKDYTKAWSLNNITDPMGKLTQIEYESNSYNKVIDVEEGTRGPAFIYRIKDLNTLGTNFDVIMEEGNNSSYPVNEFVALCSSTITGLKKTVCLPYTVPTDQSDQNIYTTDGFGILSGESTLAIASGSLTNNITGTMINNIDVAERSSLLGPGQYYHGYTFTTFSVLTQHSYSTSGLAYSGAGFIMFESPVGFEAYGGGVRVKSINAWNSSSEIYSKEYTYENGVATNEMDRFDYQVKKAYCGGSWPRYDYLRPKSCDIIEMSPSIGYTKVTVKDLGRINTADGKEETEFITDPSYNSNQFANYAINTFTSLNYSSYTTTLQTINECVNKFSSVFGAAIQSISYDKNDNQMSKTIFEYESTQQGALTENYFFWDPFITYPGLALTTVNILRDIPVVLKSTTTYGMGTVKKTETLIRDELTGEGTTIRSTGINNSSSLSYKIPAYKYYYPIEALTFTTAASRKILSLGEDLYTYTNIDTSLSATLSNSYSASFLNAGYKLYSRKMRQLQFSSSTGTMSPTDVTLDYYLNNRRFQFDGGMGSMDVYGLLKKSSLATNTLNLAATSSVSIWEPGGTTYNWRLINEITLLDAKKRALESRDMNNRFTANKYCWNSYYVNSTANNCNYASYTFADFEGPPVTYTNGISRFDGEVLGTGYSINSSVQHTGYNSIAISTSPLKFISASERSTGNTLDLGLLPGRIYRASVWTYSTNLSNAQMSITVSGVINGSTSVSSTYTANAASNLVTTIRDWSLIQLDFNIPENFSTGSSGQFKIELRSASGTVYFDDFIFHPVESNFSANVYNGQNGRVSSILDGNGLTTDYVYDVSGKTMEVWKEIPHATSTTGVYKRIKSNSYNYARGATN